MGFWICCPWRYLGMELIERDVLKSPHESKMIETWALRMEFGELTFVLAICQTFTFILSTDRGGASLPSSIRITWFHLGIYALFAVDWGLVRSMPRHQKNAREVAIFMRPLREHESLQFSQRNRSRIWARLPQTGFKVASPAIRLQGGLRPSCPIEEFRRMMFFERQLIEYELLTRKLHNMTWDRDQNHQTITVKYDIVWQPRSSQDLKRQPTGRQYPASSINFSRTYRWHRTKVYHVS